MRRDQLEHAIRAACQIIDQEAVIVVGSQAILGSIPERELPAAATMSGQVRGAHRSATVPGGAAAPCRDGSALLSTSPGTAAEPASTPSISDDTSDGVCPVAVPRSQIFAEAVEHGRRAIDGGDSTPRSLRQLNPPSCNCCPTMKSTKLAGSPPRGRGRGPAGSRR